MSPYKKQPLKSRERIVVIAIRMNENYSKGKDGKTMKSESNLAQFRIKNDFSTRWNVIHILTSKLVIRSPLQSDVNLFEAVKHTN